MGGGWAEANGALAIRAHDRILLRLTREKADAPSLSMSKGRGGMGENTGFGYQRCENKTWVAISLRRSEPFTASVRVLKRGDTHLERATPCRELSSSILGESCFSL